MKFIDITSFPDTLAHNSVSRKALLSPGDSQSDLQSVNWVELKPGEKPPSHSHSDCEEAFTFISGSGKFITDGKELSIGKMTFVLVQPNEQHVIENTGEEPLLFLSFRIKIKV